MVTLQTIPSLLYFRKRIISKALRCLDTFSVAFGYAIQWHKTQYYKQSVLPTPSWLQGYGWKCILPGGIFRFLVIHFAFEDSLVELWNVVLQRIKKLTFWVTKPLSLVGKFQICSKILVVAHVYYSSCWTASKASYLKLEKLLKDFLWASSEEHRGFHRVNCLGLLLSPSRILWPWVDPHSAPRSFPMC